MNKKLDTLISSDKRKVHFDFDGVPMNYKKNEKFAQTQDLKSANLLVYSIMIFRSEVFLDSFRWGGGWRHRARRLLRRVDEGVAKEGVPHRL